MFVKPILVIKTKNNANDNKISNTLLDIQTMQIPFTIYYRYFGILSIIQFAIGINKGYFVFAYTRLFIESPNFSMLKYKINNYRQKTKTGSFLSTFFIISPIQIRSVAKQLVITSFFFGSLTWKMKYFFSQLVSSVQECTIISWELADQPTKRT